ncbi:MAG: Snf7 family protein [Nitrososphaerales archaeon]
MTDFTKKWVRNYSTNFKDKVKDTFKSKEFIKPLIEHTIKQIQIQIAKLDSSCSRLRERGLTIFNKIVLAIQKQDMQHASILANELAEVRKMDKMVTQAKLALEQIMMRLDTAKDLGDIVITLKPAIYAARNIESDLSKVAPEAEKNIEEISNLLNEIVTSASQTDLEQINFEAVNQDAEKIIAEASIVAEQRVKETFPELPKSLTQVISEKVSETA